MIKHLACIMDGNRRWAKNKGGCHGMDIEKGVRAAERVVDFCLQQSIPYLSLYLFSIENFRRSEQEQHFLFNVLFKEFKKKVVSELAHKGVRLSFVGDQSLFPSSVQEECREIEAMTKESEKLQVNLLFCYGGRQEIVDGVKRFAEGVKEGTLSSADLTDTCLKNTCGRRELPHQK